MSAENRSLSMSNSGSIRLCILVYMQNLSNRQGLTLKWHASNIYCRSRSAWVSTWSKNQSQYSNNKCQSESLEKNILFARLSDTNIVLHVSHLKRPVVVLGASMTGGCFFMESRKVWCKPIQNEQEALYLFYCQAEERLASVSTSSGCRLPVSSLKNSRWKSSHASVRRAITMKKTGNPCNQNYGRWYMKGNDPIF